MFIVLVILALVFTAGLIVGFFKEKTYGSSLEQYILDNNPQTTSDVERLTVEYDLKTSRGSL